MKFVPEDKEFGLMHWRLLSREVDEKGEPKRAIYVLPVTGLGTYMRTMFVCKDGPVWEDPVLIKNALVIEIIRAETADSGLVDAGGNKTNEPTFKCLSRELMTLDIAKKRFMPKGKPVAPGLELYPGALLTQEQRPMVMPAGAPPPADLMKKISEKEAGGVETRP